MNLETASLCSFVNDSAILKPNQKSLSRFKPFLTEKADFVDETLRLADFAQHDFVDGFSEEFPSNGPHFALGLAADSCPVLSVVKQS